jgi:hypothetical protein
VPDLDGIRDPDEALRISQAGLDRQHQMDPHVGALVTIFDRVARENHIAMRFQNLLRDRR